MPETLHGAASRIAADVIKSGWRCDLLLAEIVANVTRNESSPAKHDEFVNAMFSELSRLLPPPESAAPPRTGGVILLR